MEQKRLIAGKYIQVRTGSVSSGELQNGHQPGLIGSIFNQIDKLLKIIWHLGPACLPTVTELTHFNTI